MAAATAIAWELGVLLGARHPTFAVLAVLFSLQGNPAGSLRTSGQRLLGVVVGVVVGLAAIHGPGLSALTAGLLILVSLLAGSLPRMGVRPNVQVAVSALLLLAGGGGWRYGLTRLWETAMGVAVAVAVSALLWPVDPVREIEGDLTRLVGLLAVDLRSVVGMFSLGRRRAEARLRTVRTHSREAEHLWMEFPETAAAVRWNPWRDRAAIGRLRARLDALAVLYRHTRSLARIAADFAASPAGPPPAEGPLVDALDALGAAAAALADPARSPMPDEVDAVDRSAERLVQAGGDARLTGALAAEIGHITADLRQWLGSGGDDP